MTTLRASEDDFFPPESNEGRQPHWTDGKNVASDSNARGNKINLSEYTPKYS
jgi:hypothetical protein